MMITEFCSHEYLLAVDACLLKLLDHVIAFKNQLSAKLTYLVLYHALLYLVPKHGLLASTFKVLIGLPLVILLARHERSGYDEAYLDDEHAD